MKTLLIKLLEYFERNEYAKVHALPCTASENTIYVIENAATGIQIEIIPDFLAVYVLKQAGDLDYYRLEGEWKFDEKECRWICTFDANGERN